MRSRRANDAMIGSVLRMLDRSQHRELARQTCTWNQADWGRLWRVIHHQGMGPRLFRSLHATDSWAPPSIHRWLGLQYRSNRKRLERMAEELSLILEAATKAGIGLILLKGSVLAFSHLADPALRPMATELDRSSFRSTFTARAGRTALGVRSGPSTKKTP